MNASKKIKTATIVLLAIGLGLIAKDLISLIPFFILTLIPVYGWIFGILLGPRLVLCYAFAIVFGIISLVKATKGKNSITIGVLTCLTMAFVGGSVGVLFLIAGILSIVSVATKKCEE